MPLLEKRTILACKQETTVGTAVTLAAADAAANYYSVEITPNYEATERTGQGAFGRLKSVVSPPSGTCKFTTYLVGGTTLPQWASTLLPACGVVFTSLTAKPVSRPPGFGGVKTVTLGVYQDGLFKQLRGAMGNVVFNFEAGKPCACEFEFTGIYDPPVDVALIAPNYPDAELPLKFTDAALNIDAYTSYGRVSTISFDIGNQVEMRYDINDPSGYCGAMITDRMPKIKFDPESNTLAGASTWDPHLWTRGALPTSITWKLGTTGNRVDFTAPWVQFVNTTDASRAGLRTDSIELVCLKAADAGDDEFSIVWS